MGELSQDALDAAFKQIARAPEVCSCEGRVFYLCAVGERLDCTAGFLVILLSAGHWDVARQALMTHRAKLRAELRRKTVDCQRMWRAVAQGFQSARFLEIKLWLVLELADLTTVRFVRALCETNTPFALTRNPLKVCLLYL